RTALHDDAMGVVTVRGHLAAAGQRDFNVAAGAGSAARLAATSEIAVATLAAIAADAGNDDAGGTASGHSAIDRTVDVEALACLAASTRSGRNEQSAGPAVFPVRSPPDVGDARLTGKIGIRHIRARIVQRRANLH